MEVGLVRPIDIDQTMQQAYLDYAMSVIVARALPDARDGLKPVHRRILYAMFDMGLRPDTAYKKSARIVGEVLGKYHPHGDMAVYESMARMAQDFSMRCLLVEGQGNFGSVDGDPPAAMRYTEARLTAPAMQMLADIRKATVDFSDNFDGSLQEPDVLPAALPNLLVNGATGIAVGMSTNIPPHNLGEVVDALIYMLDNWDRLDDVNIEDLMHFIQGPDFPTGGLIVQDTHEDDLTAAYGTGRGRVTVQSRAHIEEITRGRSRIIVTELPYMTNKSSLIERIAELSREGKLEGLADLRDESDRHGLRIVIELTRTAEPEKVLQDLFKSTPMRSTFGIILLALVDGEPRMLSLKQALRVYLDHRLTVIKRRSEYELERARQRLHILEGLRIALKHLDEIIELIRKSPDAEVARDRLMKRYRLSEIQAQAILDMQLRRLAALERKKIEDEYKEVSAEIKALEALLHSSARLRGTVASELRQVKEEYGDRRRTQITRLGAGAKSVLPVMSATDLLPEQTVWVSATSAGLVSRTLDEKPPRISGNAAPRFLLQVNTRDTLFLVGENGEAAGIPVHSLPEAGSPQDGAPLHKVSALAPETQLAALFTLPPKEERLPGWYLLTATRQGMLKKTALEELPGPTGHSFTLVKVNEQDKLGWVRLTDGKREVLLATALGMAIRFDEDEVRPMGMVAAGVGGIKLGARDILIGMELIPRRGDVLLVAADGKAKRVPADQFPRQGRYGQGVIAWKLSGSTQLVGMAVGKNSTRFSLLLDQLAPKAMRFDEVLLQTRAASGKHVVELKPPYLVLGINLPWAVPRPVEGGKATVEKELEIPEQPEPEPAPAVEQLVFGMHEPANADENSKKKPKSHRSSGEKKPASRSSAAKREPKAASTKKNALAAAGFTELANLLPADKPPSVRNGKAASLKKKTRTVKAKTGGTAAKRPTGTPTQDLLPLAPNPKETVKKGEPQRAAKKTGLSSPPKPVTSTKLRADLPAKVTGRGKAKGKPAKPVKTKTVPPAKAAAAGKAARSKPAGKSETLKKPGVKVKPASARAAPAAKAKPSSAKPAAGKSKPKPAASNKPKVKPVGATRARVKPTAAGKASQPPAARKTAARKPASGSRAKPKVTRTKSAPVRKSTAKRAKTGTRRYD